MDTKLQRLIERNTSCFGFSGNVVTRGIESFRDTEIGLQLALGKMDVLNSSNRPSALGIIEYIACANYVKELVETGRLASDKINSPEHFLRILKPFYDGLSGDAYTRMKGHLAGINAA